jgi:hypothetical protein
MSYGPAEMRRALDRPNPFAVEASRVILSSDYQAGPDDKAAPALSDSVRTEAGIRIYNEISARLGGKPVSQAEYESVLSHIGPADLQRIAERRGSVGEIVSSAIQQDAGLAAKITRLGHDVQLAALGGDPSLMNLDALGRNYWARITGGAGASASSGSTAYGALAAGERYDPAKGWGTLTAENFKYTEFAQAGLDYNTTMRMALAGFSPTAIRQAAALTRDLGIDVKEHVEAVGRLRRDVKGIEGTLRTLKGYKDTIEAAEKAAKEAEARGDTVAASEQRAKAEEARRKRDELEKSERERIAREKPDRLPDYDRVVTAIMSAGPKASADQKSGLITQEQLDAVAAKTNKEIGAVVTTRVNEAIRDEAINADNPDAVPPKRVAEINTVVENEVRPVGVDVAQDTSADLFGGVDTAAADAPPPAVTVADAGAKAEDPKPGDKLAEVPVDVAAAEVKPDKPADVAAAEAKPDKPVEVAAAEPDPKKKKPTSLSMTV